MSISRNLSLASKMIIVICLDRQMPQIQFLSNASLPLCGFPKKHANTSVSQAFPIKDSEFLPPTLPLSPQKEKADLHDPKGSFLLYTGLFSS